MAEEHTTTSEKKEEGASLHFIEQIIADDLQSGKHQRIHTRFPPEPNGYLHIGHAKAICLSFGLAEKYEGLVNLRFDDTNPEKENQEYVDAIRRDVSWLGYDWNGGEFYTSDHFEQLYGFAVKLIELGKAYVDHQTAEEMAAQKGTPTTAGTNSPHRDRPVKENLRLFQEMRDGVHPDGHCVLRAKIDMAHTNMHMRDPLLYRIKRAHHPRTGDDWCLYPMYDFAHGICDSIEKITHSICTLEFEHHRPLYDWFLDELDIFRSRQYEFARLNITHTVMSKRRLLELVENDYVQGWDDPRMPTISGLRRRGYTPEAIRQFCARIGVTKQNSTHDISWLEDSLRAQLNKEAQRRAAVLRPLKVIIDNFPEGHVEMMEAVNNPEDPSAGTRQIPFTRELYIEQTDFMEEPPKKFFRLGPGREVRLRYGFFITCHEVIKDDEGRITELRCTYDPETRGGQAPDGRKVRGTIHWVSANHAVDAEIRLYDHLFETQNPSDVEQGKSYLDNINPNSLEVLSNCKLEPSLADAQPGERFQFERLGYFCVDSQASNSNKPVFNRSVTLRDTWAKMQRKG